MILAINGGSSSIKFSLYRSVSPPEKVYSGQISRIGLPGAIFRLVGSKENIPCVVADYTSAISCLVNWLEKQAEAKEITAIGHRVVHGMQHIKPCLISDNLLEKLKLIIPYDPDHLPNEIKLIEEFREHYPKIRQFACFDTAFHQTMPRVARQLPIPRHFDREGIQRYGFHGLSYQYLMQELEALVGQEAAQGRIILCHLGAGASIAAVYRGKSVDTSMGFTPTGGLPMGTRSGDLDPGVAWVMMKNGKLSLKQFSQIINHESGLLGISETSGDMADLLKQEAADIRSAEAVDLFCYELKKRIGAFAAVLGGVDFLVFSGGIGENEPVVRERVCSGLEFLGIELNSKHNKENASVISANETGVSIHVLHTDEELMIAKIVRRMIANKNLTYQEKKYENEQF